MANKFKVGDVIKLKTGGHSMTITGNATTHTQQGNIAIPDRYECFWFDGKKHQKAVFREDMIVMV